ncbi:hypothetical protein AJ80_10065 [Polytolypa hystricis UAMH7299]|uniref:Uncharacterized protein n=1 Tax=Polytolypa hystricis (strain UAMH7299) TaxID=1447883 RepID=A0A2B7WEE9_POLH7|nr:hypothetical protein AJ80_10065 [Polytolypa hystricis UAMH7299]
MNIDIGSWGGCRHHFRGVRGVPTGTRPGRCDYGQGAPAADAPPSVTSPPAAAPQLSPEASMPRARTPHRQGHRRAVSASF